MKRSCEACGRERPSKTQTRKCACGGRFVPAETPREPPASRAGTSAGAARNAARFMGRMQRRVLEALVARGERGGTDEEVMEELGTSANGVRPRRVELEAQGLVGDSGQRRKTRSGLEAIVWWATFHGRKAIKETDAGYLMCLKRVRETLEGAERAIEAAKRSIQKTPCKCEPCVSEQLSLFAVRAGETP